MDIFGVSETWLKPHLHSNRVSISGYQSYRLDRPTGPKTKKKRGGGLITYVSEKYASVCEPLIELDRSDKNIETQWILLHRANCKNVVTCNLYRPPNGNLKKVLDYLDDCVKSLNISKLGLFLIGDWKVDYQNRQSPNYKKLNFFGTSNGLSQFIKNTTCNTNKTTSLIDLALTNSKFVSSAGVLEHFISDHQQTSRNY